MCQVIPAESSLKVVVIKIGRRVAMIEGRKLPRVDVLADYIAAFYGHVAGVADPNTCHLEAARIKTWISKLKAIGSRKRRAKDACIS